MNAACVRWCITALVCCSALTAAAQDGRLQIGREVAIPRHLQDGEALSSRQNSEALAFYDRDCMIEFLKTLQIFPPGTSHADR